MKYDLRINSRGKVDAMKRGFLDKTATDNQEYVEFGDYRIDKQQYESKKAKFDEYLKRVEK